MKIGIGSKAYYNVYDYEQGFKKLKAHGYDCVDYNDLTDFNSELYNLQAAEFSDFFKRVEASATDCGIDVWQMHAIWPTVNQDKTEADREKTLGYFVRQIEAAYYLGCKFFVMHPFMPPNQDPELTFSINTELIKRLIPYAENFDVTICIENMPFADNQISKVSEIKRLISFIGHPRVKACLDTGHANMFSSDIATDVRVLGCDLAALHIHDNSGWCDAHRFPYCGTVKWDDLLIALREIGFNGCFNLETSVSKSMPEPYREQMQVSLATLTREMAEKI